MVNIIKEGIDEYLKKRLEFIFVFLHATSKFIKELLIRTSKFLEILSYSIVI